MKNSQEKKIKYIVIGAFALLVLAVAFLLIMQQIRVNEKFFDYNGYQVEKTVEGYRLRLFLNNAEEPVYLRIREDPREIENISVEEGIKEKITGKKQMYVVINPEENLTGVTTLAALELDKVIDNPFLFNIPLNSGFTKQISGKENITVMDCVDANEEIGIIKLQIGTTTRVYSQGECIIIEADKEENLIKAANKLDLVLLGVLNG